MNEQAELCSQVLSEVENNASKYGNSYCYQRNRIALKRSVVDNKKLLSIIKPLLQVAKAADWNRHYKGEGICPHLEMVLDELPPEVKRMFNEY